MKRLFAALAIGFAAVPASAGVIHYTIHDAVFDDGGTVVGSFNYDTDLHSWSGGAHTSAGTTYEGFTYFGSGSADHNISFSEGGNGLHTLLLSIDGSWAEAGLYNFSLTGLFTDSFETFSNQEVLLNRQLVSGYAVADGFEVPPGGTRVPEPAMLGLFGLGAIGLSLSRRRRKA